MSSTSLEIALLTLLILANGVFSMAEMAVVSSRKARLRQRAAEGSRGSAVALDLAESPNDFLSTVQIGITMIGTLAGAFGGATLAEEFAVYLNAFPFIAPHGESVAITIVVILITYASLILGELVPKNIALSHPEAIASMVAPPMRALSRVGSPIVALLTISTRAVMFLIPAKASGEAPVTEEEIKVLIAQGAEHGTFAEAEQEMVEGVFRLGDRTVAELMRSRLKVVWLDLAAGWAANQRTILETDYSVYPVASGDLDNLVGLVHVKQVLAAMCQGGAVDLPRLATKPLYFPEQTPALKALEELQASPSRMAVVIDEHGGVEGIVTLTDLLNAVVGALNPEADSTRPRATLRDDGSWLVDGTLPVRDFLETIGLKELPGGTRGFTTVAGLVLARMDRIPSPGDSVMVGDWLIEVADLDGMRVDKLIVTRRPAQSA